MNKKTQLTKQQSEASKKIKEWYNDNKEQIFVLSGAAGTGKSFLINFIVDELGLNREEEIAFVTPTGKSAEVLVSRGIDAQTVHKLMYNVDVKQVKIKDKDGKETIKEQLKFIKKTSLGNLKLIIIDEFSMIDDLIFDDLKSYKIKIIAIGDIFQLQPVNGINSYMKSPDYILTEVVRQSADNPILKLATDMRNDVYISNLFDYNCEQIQFISRKTISNEKLKELFFSHDQILVGTNKTKKKVDNLFRQFKGIDIEENKLPLKDEKVICLMNNWEKMLDKNYEAPLVNGQICFLKENSKKQNDDLDIGTMKLIPPYGREGNFDEVPFDCGAFLSGTYKFQMHEKAFFLIDGTYYPKTFLRIQEGESKAEFKKRYIEYAKKSRMSINEEKINRLDFAYAITVHKSQGSEWDNVLIFDESYIFGEDRRKWLYTAITRAKKKLTIII